LWGKKVEVMNMIGNNSEVHNYVANAKGINRIKLNIEAAIGVLIWIFLVLVYMRLGKWKIGTGLFIACLILIVTGLSAGEGSHFARIAGLTYLAISIIAWIYANIILSQYKKAAKLRISEIDRKRPRSVNDFLEKGILCQKILEMKDCASQAFNSALAMENGDDLFWNIGGINLFDMEKYSEATQAFSRATKVPSDKSLAKEIESKKKLAKKKSE
jgi:tetratricopeptide (TPR) repeat protein